MLQVIITDSECNPFSLENVLLTTSRHFRHFPSCQIKYNVKKLKLDIITW